MDLAPLQADLDIIYTGLFSDEATLDDGSSIRYVPSSDNEIGLQTGKAIQIIVRATQCGKFDTESELKIKSKTYSVISKQKKDFLELEYIVDLVEI